MEEICGPLRDPPSVCGPQRGSGGSAAQLAFSSPLQSGRPDRRCAGGRVLQGNCSLHGWRDPGPEGRADLLKATSSELELELGFIQGHGFHSLLPICGLMD